MKTKQFNKPSTNNEIYLILLFEGPLQLLKCTSNRWGRKVRAHFGHLTNCSR